MHLRLSTVFSALLFALLALVLVPRTASADVAHAAPAALATPAGAPRTQAPTSRGVAAMTRGGHAVGFGAGVAVTLAVQPFVGKRAFQPVVGPKIQRAAMRMDPAKHPVARQVVYAVGTGAAAAPPATRRAEQRLKEAFARSRRR